MVRMALETWSVLNMEEGGRRRGGGGEEKGKGRLTSWSLLCHMVAAHLELNNAQLKGVTCKPRCDHAFVTPVRGGQIMQAVCQATRQPAI